MVLADDKWKPHEIISLEPLMALHEK